jgi:hypothetical protein
MAAWRLTTRLEQLKKQHGWGDISDREYQIERDSIHATLAQLPDGDRIRTFDAFRAQLLALPSAIAAASPARREVLCRIVVERVVVNDRTLEQMAWAIAPAEVGTPKRIRTADLSLERAVS